MSKNKGENSSLKKQDTCKNDSLHFLHEAESDTLQFRSYSKTKYSEDAKQNVSVDRGNTLFKKEKEIDDLNNSSVIFQEKNKKPKNCRNGSVNSHNATEIDTFSVRLDSSITDEIPITDPTIKALKGKGVQRSKIDADDENPSNITNQCPICFKSVTKYVTHMKSCAAKHKLSTQQLLSAIKLQKRQLAERRELGLGVPASSFRAKVSPKRSKRNDNKGTKDPSLQLALALSASLRSAEEDEVIQEAEVLKEAGLSQEAHQKLSILENFGFHSALSVCSRGAGVPKSSSLSSSLLRRTKEERERIITEKVAIVLINEEVTLDYFENNKPVVKSNTLKEIWSNAAILWAQAHYPVEVQREAFYVPSLSAFVSPSKTEVGHDMRHLSQLPGRLKTPDCSDKPDQHTTIKKDTDVVSRKSTLPDVLEKLVKDWKSLINNSEWSDITIRCRDGEILPAHKLVFCVRCPSILNQIVKEGDSNEVLIWDNCSRTAVIALLDYIYSGCLNKLLSLELEDLTNIDDIAKTMGDIELKKVLGTILSPDKSLSLRQICSNTKRKLFEGISDSQYDLNQDFGQTSRSNALSYKGEISPKSADSYNSLNLEKNISLDCINVGSGKESPDMFDESKVTDPFNTQGDLEMLASLVGKGTSEVENYLPNNSSAEKLKISTKSKRKLSDSSSSLDGSVCLFKKSRKESKDEDEFITGTSKYEVEEVVFDLTQSSNSSNEASKSDGPILLCDDSPKNRNIEDRNSEDDEYIGDLTQRDPSLSPKKLLSVEKSTIEEGAISSVCEDNNEAIYPEWCDYDDDYWQYYNYNTPPKLPDTPSNKSVDLKIVDSSTNLKQTVHTSCVIESPKSLPVSISSNSASPQRLSPIASVQSQNLSTPKGKSRGQNEQRILDPPLPDSAFKEQGSFISNEIDKNLCLDHTPISCQKKLQTSEEFANRQSCSLLDSIIKSESDKIVESNMSSYQVSQTPHNQASSTTKKSSLDSMQRLLDDTFEVNDSLFLMAEAEDLNSLPTCKESKDNSSQDVLNMKKGCSSRQPELPKISKPLASKNENIITTPPQDIVVSDNVTPLPNYSAMKTPFLKKELTKFGMKPSLGKRKAKMLLRFIYDQTHPVVPDKEQVNNPEKGPPISLAEHPSKSQVDDCPDSEPEEHLSQNSSNTSISTLMEETCDWEDIDGQLSQEASSKGDVQTAIRNLILGDSELHKKVVMYEAIFLEDLMKIIKERKIKAKTDEVKKFLDEQCITFRTHSWKATNNRRRMRSPKKKRNNSEGKIAERQRNVNNLQSDSTTNVLKKRGRPRKTAL